MKAARGYAARFALLSVGLFGCNPVLGIEPGHLAESHSAIEGCGRTDCDHPADAGHVQCDGGCASACGGDSCDSGVATGDDGSKHPTQSPPPPDAKSPSDAGDSGLPVSNPAPVADGGDGGSACASDELDCQGLTPRSCQQGELQPAGAACPFACRDGRCMGECRDAETRCSGDVFERCSDARFVAVETCAGTCSSQTGCADRCAQGSFDCDGARQRTRCNAAGQWEAAELCGFSCTHGVCGQCDPNVVSCADEMTAQSCDADAQIQTQPCAHGCKDGACQRCVGGDNSCPVGCDAQSDSDCQKAVGADCVHDSDCGLGHCAGGVCCERACTGACEACDLANSRGMCVARDLSQSDDASNCGACGAACSSKNITTPACSAGQCVGSCAAHFDDCNHDKRSDGCETALDSDPKHCGDCNSVCTYGVCQAGVCASSQFGNPAAGTNSINLGANTQECVGLHVSKVGLLAALGAQTITAGVGLRIGLYRDDGSLAPQGLVAQTDALTTRGGGATEGLVPLTAVTVADYWLCVVSDSTLRMAAEAGKTTWWYAPFNYGTLPAAAGSLQSAQVARGDVYAVTVPQTQTP